MGKTWLFGPGGGGGVSSIQKTSSQKVHFLQMYMCGFENLFE